MLEQTDDPSSIGKRPSAAAAVRSVPRLESVRRRTREYPLLQAGPDQSRQREPLAGRLDLQYRRRVSRIGDAVQSDHREWRALCHYSEASRDCARRRYRRLAMELRSELGQESTQSRGHVLGATYLLRGGPLSILAGCAHRKTLSRFR